MTSEGQVRQDGRDRGGAGDHDALGVQGGLDRIDQAPGHAPHGQTGQMGDLAALRSTDTTRAR
ncbi:hypothetical protein ACQEU6_31585 [Spirillospora sp. CA-108201]